ncbi:hypothetical protein [Hyphomicrobium sp. ghe19]|uniref:hypothetical protein n=1 Tax=Hyphomicrobium sp. ghe19 TaxID=2682968 RepID=UPI0013679BBB|nr:hypothetical protein HYPP_00684 [Hyphomicrobium sp. ghe19]
MISTLTIRSLPGLILALLLFGCGDEPPRQQSTEKRSGLTKPHKIEWLTAQDDISPETWLIEREANSGATLTRDEVGNLHQLLANASNTFTDSPRMVANRAVQLEAMLKAEGGDETAVSLIGRLTGVVAPGRIESFGAAGQQYFNMRKAGFSGQQALDELSKRYGSRG